jgi:hypothetical protein
MCNIQRLSESYGATSITSFFDASEVRYFLFFYLFITLTFIWTRTYKFSIFLVLIKAFFF